MATSRRDFLRRTGASLAGLALGPAVLTRPAHIVRLHPEPLRPVPPSDTIGLGMIGMGIMGFGNARTALQVPGVRLVAVADCYDGRLVRTKEVFGADVFTTRDYREVLARPDVDAVVISTPDHLHAQIAIEAMEAGKDVYLEKPMVQRVEDGLRVIEAERRTGRVLIVGSQRVSSILYAKARELYRSGAIGQLNMVEAYMNRNSATGAWQYTIPPDASPQTVDWERFLGPAPHRPFDPVRFFRWRNYWDYGTGIPGDLFVHLFSGIHFVLDALGPTRIYASGGLRFWKDGREVPDVMAGLYEYPDTAAHPSFTLSLKVNFANGGGGGEAFRFIGDEGMIEIGWGQVRLSKLPPRRLTEQELLGWNSLRTFPEAMQRQILEAFRAENPPQREVSETQEVVYQAPPGYDDRLDHFRNFFEAVRTRGRVVEDGTFGFRAAAPALLTNTSYLENRAIGWDPENMRQT
ncbi:Gfo/Idh/MocA family protein [Rhodothermus marinus]|uniref:Gfo/Idh/MocA family protein n=1 Tax=Rhodothermus marinus TaxID=29549 RepID=UPI001D5FF9B1|nr:Gfo/Idh/MocA family oxidoreductase [Rhodothermus marinus]MBO2492517.1 Gfo/Idh/MocA family oxidoreductase [Rhodothermus marinus]